MKTLRKLLLCSMIFNVDHSKTFPERIPRETDKKKETHDARSLTLFCFNIDLLHSRLLLHPPFSLHARMHAFFSTFCLHQHTITPSHHHTHHIHGCVQDISRLQQYATYYHKTFSASATTSGRYEEQHAQPQTAQL